MTTRPYSAHETRWKWVEHVRDDGSVYSVTATILPVHGDVWNDVEVRITPKGEHHLETGWGCPGYVIDMSKAAWISKPFDTLRAAIEYAELAACKRYRDFSNRVIKAMGA